MEIHMHHLCLSRRMMALLLGGLLAAGAASATATAPAPPSAATTPAAPAVKADFSSPVAAVTTLVTALHEGDFATARAALIIPDEHKSAIDAFLDTMAATARLQQAASAKYLSAADAHFPPPSPESLAARLKRVAAGELTVNGDTATLIVATGAATPTTTQPAIQTLRLAKIGAAWNVDGASFFSLTAEPADKTAARAARARNLAAIADAVAADISAGKFFSAADAYQEYWSRCLQAVTLSATAASAPVTATKP
jgi:hypothetical protein